MLGRGNHSVNIVFVVTLLLMFALTALSVAVMGAQVYSSSAQRMTSNFETRTSLMYMAEKVRQCAGDNLDIRKVGDSDALVIKESIGGEDVESWIFVAKGKLREATLKAGAAVEEDDGNDIMPLKSMNLSLDGRLLLITVKNPDGKANSLTICRRE